MKILTPAVAGQAPFSPKKYHQKYHRPPPLPIFAAPVFTPNVSTVSNNDIRAQLRAFTLRVYGLWVNSRHELLVADELIRGRAITKLPGGGLELGEGLLDGLHREWHEELGLPVLAATHLYTTDFFQQSAFNPEHQIVAIYYRVHSPEDQPLRAIDPTIEPELQGFRWVPLHNMDPSAALTLPTDQRAARELLRSLGA